MRIHTKLFLLLLAIAVLPLVVLTLRGQRATENLGTAIATRGRAALSLEIEAQLQQTIAYSSDILSAQQREVEMALRVQALEAERRLAALVPVIDPSRWRFCVLLVGIPECDWTWSNYLMATPLGYVVAKVLGIGT